LKGNDRGKKNDLAPFVSAVGADFFTEGQGRRGSDRAGQTRRSFGPENEQGQKKKKSAVSVDRKKLEGEMGAEVVGKGA